MRYIIFEDASGHPVPILFPARIEYEDMREQMPYATVRSAGRVRAVGQDFECSGAAPALNAHSAPEDAAILARHFAKADA